MTVARVSTSPIKASTQPEETSPEERATKFAKSTKPKNEGISDKDVPEGPKNKEEFEAKAEENGWKAVGENDELPPTTSIKVKRQDTTTITYEYGGETYAVSSHVSPFKYSVLENKVEGMEIRQNDNNVNINVPESAATDFMNAETTEDGKSVGELFNQYMKDEWSSLELSDPRRQYYELMQARAALTSGFYYYPNRTEKGVGADNTDMLPNPVVMDSASTYGLLKEEEIDAKLNELLENESITSGVDGLMEKAVDKIKDKNGLTNRVYNAMMSDEYSDLLAGMSKGAAATRFSNDIQALDFLDPEKAAEVRSKHEEIGISPELIEKIKKGEYTQEDLDKSSKMWADYLLEGVARGAFEVVFADKTVQEYIKADGQKNADKLTADQKEKADAYLKARKVLAESIADGVGKGLKGDELTKHVAKTIADGKIEDIRSDRHAKGLLGQALGSGLVAAVGGMAVLGAVIKSAVEGNGNSSDSTPEEQMALARAITVVIATSPASIGKIGLGVVGKWVDQPGMSYMLGFEGDNSLISDSLRAKFKEAFPNAFKKPDAPDPTTVTNITPEDIDADDIPGYLDAIESGKHPTVMQAAIYSQLIDVVGRSPHAPQLNLVKEYMEDIINNNRQEHLSENTYRQLDNLKKFIADYKSTGPGDPIQASIDALVEEYRKTLPADGSGASGTQWFDDVANGRVELRPTTTNLDDIVAPGNEKLNAVQDSIGDEMDKHIKTYTPEQKDRAYKAIDDTIKSAGMDPDKMSPNAKLRWVGAIWGVTAGSADLVGGVLDIVVGVKTLQSLEGDPNATDLQKAAAAIQITSGAGLAAYATSSLAATMVGGSAAAWLGVAAGVTGFIGVGIGVIGMIITGVIAKNKQEQALEDTAQDFRDWASLGITEDNWGDKFNYLQNARYEYDYEYGSKDYFEYYPEDTPVWEARPEQYKDFTEYLDSNSSLSDNWFDDWDKDHGVEINGYNNPDEKDGDHVIGSDDKSNKPGKGAGTFGDFKEDIDLVDVGTIELRDDGWIHFRKNGYMQAVKAGVGDGWDNDDDSHKVAEYLTQLYELTHPDGKRDEDIIKRITDLHNESDKYNEIEDLRRVLSDDFVPMLGKDDGKPGTPYDFRTDIDRVELDSIELDPEDSSVIYFVKDGKKWMLDKDNNGSLSDDDAKEIYTYLHELHDLIRPDGDNIDQEVLEEASKKHDEGDRHNTVYQLRDHLVETFPEKYGKEATPFGITYDEEGSVDHNRIGTPSDFIEDVDKVDVGTIAISEDGRKVVFVKDGFKQRITDSNETNSEIIRYLKGLHDLVKGDEDRAREMDRVFGATDDYNSLDKIRAYMDPPKPRTWADETPVDKNVTSDIGNGDAGDFKEDMDKIDAASIRVVKDGGNTKVYFMKENRWHVMEAGDHLGGGFRDIYNQLVMIANMTDSGKDLKLAARIDQIWDRTDDYNEASKLDDYLIKIGALSENY